jgi:hypothetical protein
MKYKIDFLLRAVLISVVFIVIVGIGYTNMQYRLDYIEIINECFEGGYDDQIIRDKVIIGNQEYLFYGRDDIGYGYIKLERGLNKKYKILRKDKSSQYFQIINPVIKSKMFNIIIGHNPQEGSISCELSDSFIHNNIVTGDFVLIYNSDTYTTITKEEIVFKDENGINITAKVTKL